MPDHALRQIGPLFLRYQGADFEFDFHRIVLDSPVETSAQSTEMRIYRNARNSESMPQHNVCRFATNAGKQNQLFESLRNFPSKICHDLHGQTLDVLGFSSEEPCRVDQDLDGMKVSLRELLHVRIFLEKCRGHGIYALIGALRREHRSHQQLQGVGEVQFTMNIGVTLAEDFVDGPGLLNRARISHHSTKVTRLRPKG